MEKIEIRQIKAIFIPILILMTITLFGMTYYIYFSGKFDNNAIMKIAYVFLNAFIIYYIFIQTKKIIKNEPVLTFSKSEIKINDNGESVSYLWLQIIEWKIEENKEDGTHHLIIETANKKRRINISLLDKRPSEIEDLLRKYKIN